MGFIVAAIVIVLYVVMITKAIYVAKTAKDDIRTDISQYGISRNINFPHDRKYRNDNGTFANNRGTTSFCKLWRKFTNYKLYMYRTFA